MGAFKTSENRVEKDIYMDRRAGQEDDQGIELESGMPKDRISRPSAIVLYHFFHPDDVVSAQHLSDFSEELAKRGWDITVLTSNRSCRYPGNKISPRNEDWRGVAIKRVYRPGWNQANNYLRILNSLWMMAGWMIKLSSMATADVVIIGTDPQFSALLFPFIKLLKKGKLLAHWCYDLYPEAIIADGASGLVKWFSGRLSRLMGRAYQSVDFMVDIGPCMRKRLNAYRHHARSATLVPWALLEPLHLQKPDRLTREELFGGAKLAILYSGNMGKAHDFALFLRLARILRRREASINICFGCRGNRSKELRKAVGEEDTNIRFAPFAEEVELEKRLNSADIHLLSLRPEWSGIVVPSKFFGSLAAAKPVLYAGPEDSAIAEWIRMLNAGWILSEKNLERLADELSEIANNKQKLHVFQENAYSAYHKMFSKKIVMDEWDRAMRTLLHEQKTTKPCSLAHFPQL